MLSNLNKNILKKPKGIGAIIQISVSWLLGTWVVLMMSFLQNPVYYLVGFASSALALVNLLKVRKLPLPKHGLKGVAQIQAPAQ